MTFTLSGGAVGDTVTLPVTISSTNYADSTVNVAITLISDETSHTIGKTSTENGTITVDPESAAAGQKVTVTVAPDEHYELEELKVTDENGKSVELKKESETTYTFEMPDCGVTVTGSFAPDGICPRDETCPIEPFGDTLNDFWWHDGIHFCIERGLMNGVADGVFAPDDPLTRGMIVTILWRVEGSPMADYNMSFEDVEPDEWYTEAIRWAQSTGVVEGFSDEMFGPKINVTREQLAAILHRYARYKGIDVSARAELELFEDAVEISDWAVENVKWSVAVGIINGRTDTTIVPTGNSTRAEAACMMQRFCETILHW